MAKTNEKEDEDPDKESVRRHSGVLRDLIARGTQWLKFDDDKVSTVPRTRVAALDGGGEILSWISLCVLADSQA